MDKSKHEAKNSKRIFLRQTSKEKMRWPILLYQLERMQVSSVIVWVFFCAARVDIFVKTVAFLREDKTK